jgi:hypothetical protein
MFLSIFISYCFIIIFYIFLPISSKNFINSNYDERPDQFVIKWKRNADKDN